MDKQLHDLLNKQFITNEELQLIEENEFVSHTENNGCSGLHIGFQWYLVYIPESNCQSYNVYVK